MDQARRDWIDEVADAVRRVYAIGSPVGDMQDVVKNMGGKGKCQVFLGNSFDCR